jgi:hypothetical protein
MANLWGGQGIISVYMTLMVEDPQGWLVSWRLFPNVTAPPRQSPWASREDRNATGPD